MKEKATVYNGGCHCGAIRFQVDIEALEALDCNCSICRKKGFLHLIVESENFRLLQGSEFLSTYTFNTKVAQHHFCRVCGIHPFYRPRSHPEGIDVNARCLDGDVLSKFKVIPFDGANWEENIARIRPADEDKGDVLY